MLCMSKQWNPCRQCDFVRSLCKQAMASKWRSSGMRCYPTYIPDKGRQHWQSSWWRHQMETFSALLAICAGNSPVPGEFSAQRPVTQSFDVFFDLHLNKRLSKQSCGWWFETLSHPLWRLCNVLAVLVSLVELGFTSLSRWYFDPCWWNQSHILGIPRFIPVIQESVYGEGVETWNVHL